MKPRKLSLCISLLCLINLSAQAQPNRDLTHQIKQMFTTMVVKKNILSMPQFYARSFILHSNGNDMSYNKFYQIHKKVYSTNIQYKIKYDNKTWVEHGNKIAGRLYITTITPKEKTDIEVIFIAQYNKNKISELWEVTYPNWAKLKAFKAAKAH
ncbi:MAG: hypothetical protein P1U63_02420 [Coxiellaceae bacterium]|nr:hypothetical protein [Coxiellaceae bacterium]